MSSKRLTIGMVSFDGFEPIGGMGRHVVSLAEGIRNAGYRVHIFDRHARSCFWSIGRNLTWSLFLRHSLKRWALQEGIDILHVHTGPGGALLFSNLSIPLIVTANHTYAQQSRLPRQGWKKILTFFERRTYECASKVVCISEDTAHSLEVDYSIDRSRLSVIPCGIDVARFRSYDREQRNRHHALFVGRPDTRKGWDLLLSAWDDVLRHIPDAVLHIVGCTQSGHHPSLQFHGTLDDDALSSLLGSVGLLVCPSRLEGFGLISAEAIVSGTPVVACDVAGLRRIVDHHRSGLLVAPTTQAISDAIQSCMQDDHLWSQLRDGGRSARSDFDHRTEILAHIELYTQVYSASSCAHASRRSQ